MDYWKKSPPIHLLVGSILKMGRSESGSPPENKFVPSSEEEIKGLVNQFRTQRG